MKIRMLYMIIRSIKLAYKESVFEVNLEYLLHSL